MVYLFDVPAYVILLRETLEVTIIFAVIYGFVDKLTISDDLKKQYKKQIWIGTAAGLGVSLLIGAIFIIVFYTIKKDLWEDSEPIWEGVFSLIASIVITVMSLSMVRVQKWKIKWENKLKEATEQHVKKHEQGNKWALVLLPFTVVCREAVESIVFIAGIGFQQPASGLPIPVITGILSGFLLGFIIYKGSHKISLKIFFGITTVILLFIAAGLFSNSIHEFEEVTDNKHVIWEFDCCDPETNKFWDLLNSLFGWRNEATVGTTVGYFMYWFFIGLISLYLVYKEKRKAALERNLDPPSSNDVIEEKN